MNWHEQWYGSDFTKHAGALLKKLKMNLTNQPNLTPQPNTYLVFMTKRERPTEWAAELHDELQEIRDELPKEEVATPCEDPTHVTNCPTVANSTAEEKLGEGPFWDLLALVGYTKW